MCSMNKNKIWVKATKSILILCIILSAAYFIVYLNRGNLDNSLRISNAIFSKDISTSENTNKLGLADENVKPGTFVLRDLSVYDNVSKEYISIGMSREQIEESLGMEGFTFGNDKASYHYKGLKVLYRDNKAAGLTITKYNNIEELRERAKNEENVEINNGKYVTARGIGLDCKKNDVVNIYGESGNGTGSNILIYFLQKIGDSIEILPPIGEPQPQNKNDQYYLSFCFSMDNQEKAEFIQIGDYEFTFFQR